MATSANSRVAGWRLEDIDDNLAADFDGSLSGLGVDLSVASYNMRSVPLNYLLVGGTGSPSRLVHYHSPPTEVTIRTNSLQNHTIHSGETNRSTVT